MVESANSGGSADSAGDDVPSGNLPLARERGPPPEGVRLEVHDRVGERLVADKDFEIGDLVLREEFLLLGPTELPPLDMFSPVPADVANVEMEGDGFPGVTSWDHLHLKLLFEFVNAEEDVQADALRMQDSMCAGETRQSIERVARWLADRQRPWLSEFNFHDIFRLLRMFCVNSYPCQAAGKTSGLLKWGTMINHSCRPNVTFHSVREGDTFEGRYRAVRRIKKGEVVGSSYMKPSVGLASLQQRRRVLWCLKGFVCCCDRCCEEALHGDKTRLLSCKDCASNCSMPWSYHPSVGSFTFASEESGAIASPDDIRNESIICAEVICALFSRLPSFEEAKERFTPLKQRSQALPEDHFARRALDALLLSLEGEFLTSSQQRPRLTPDASKTWLAQVSALRDWLKRLRGEPDDSLLLFLSFGGLAPSIRDLVAVAKEFHDGPWLQEMEEWAQSMLSLDNACSNGKTEGAVESSFFGEDPPEESLP